MQSFHKANLVLETADMKAGSIQWSSPSNIAIVKYWGKHGVQLPKNASLSFTLREACTDTSLHYSAQQQPASDGLDMSFYFDDKPQPAFEARIRKYLLSILDIFPFLRQLKLEIRSNNNFPHSAGIASSASAMSALALCLCSLEDELFGTLKEDELYRKKSSYVARLGSGSACRSIYSQAAFWGKHGEVEGSSDEYAVPVADSFHSSFDNYNDDILIVTDSKKSVSSGAGHSLMETHPFADSRFRSANQRIHRLLAALKSGDLAEFVRITESEALTLHGLMMSSNPGYILLAPNTLEIVKRVQDYRSQKNIPICFTLDAGPNPHLLYPASFAEELRPFIDEELKPFYSSCIRDGMGIGPVQGE